LTEPFFVVVCLCRRARIAPRMATKSIGTPSLFYKSRKTRPKKRFWGLVI